MKKFNNLLSKTILISFLALASENVFSVTKNDLKNSKNNTSIAENSVFENQLKEIHNFVLKNYQSLNENLLNQGSTREGSKYPLTLSQSISQTEKITPVLTEKKTYEELSNEFRQKIKQDKKAKSLRDFILELNNKKGGVFYAEKLPYLNLPSVSLNISQCTKCEEKNFGLAKPESFFNCSTLNNSYVYLNQLKQLKDEGKTDEIKKLEQHLIKQQLLLKLFSAIQNNNFAENQSLFYSFFNSGISLNTDIKERFLENLSKEEIADLKKQSKEKFDFLKSSQYPSDYHLNQIALYFFDVNEISKEEENAFKAFYPQYLQEKLDLEIENQNINTLIYPTFSSNVGKKEAILYTALYLKSSLTMPVFEKSKTSPNLQDYAKYRERGTNKDLFLNGHQHFKNKDIKIYEVESISDEEKAKIEIDLIYNSYVRTAFTKNYNPIVILSNDCRKALLRNNQCSILTTYSSRHSTIRRNFPFYVDLDKTLPKNPQEREVYLRMTNEPRIEVYDY